MSITYQFVADNSYFKAVIERYYKQRPFLFKPPVQYTLLLTVVACIWLYGSAMDASLQRSLALMLPFLVAVGFLAVRLTSWGIMQRFKRQADFGKQTTVTLSDEGVTATGEHVQSKWTWAAYPRSVRFPDGLLLMRTGVIRWLPDSALQDGTAEQAAALVGSKSNLRRVA